MMQDKRQYPSFSIIVVSIALVMLGLVLIPRLSVKLNPSRKTPVIHVSFNMWGQSALVVESEVTSKLEGMLCRIKGVQEISSYSSNGYGSITARLSEHADPDMARFEASTIIRQIWPLLPPGVSYPSIGMSGATDETSYPFLRYTVNAPVSPILIQEYVENNLKTKLSELKGVDRVDVHGAGRMIYKLDYDHVLLQRHGVSPGDIRSAIRSYLNREFFGTGRINDENNRGQWIRIALVPAAGGGGAFDPSLIQVKNRHGTIIYLDQLVSTSFEEEEASSYFRINGLNTINLSVTADNSANQVKLSGQAKEMMKELEKKLPAGYELHLLYDATEYIKAEINKIYFRSGLTVLILLCFVFLFYRNLKYSLLIVSSLVANILVAFIFYYLLKVELQLFSLAGLTISLTLIIDNTIIMLDHLVKRGNRRVFFTIFTATVTTLGALIIVFLMEESIRLNLIDFVRVLIINLTVSLFIALFLVPALMDKFNMPEKGKGKKKAGRPAGERAPVSSGSKKGFPVFRRFVPGVKRRAASLFRGKRALMFFNRAYEGIIFFMYRRKGWFISILLLAFGLPVFLLPDRIENKTERFFSGIEENTQPAFWAKLYNNTLGSEFYKEKIKPVSDVALGGTMRLFVRKVKNGSYSSGERGETSLHVAATLPNGSTKEQMDFLIRKMEGYLSQYPEIRQFETNIENGMRAGIRILFVKKHQRGSFPHVLKSRLISKALELGGGSWSVYGLGDGFNNEIKDQAGSNRIKLLGYNYDNLNALALAMRDSLLQYRRIKEVTIDSKFSWYKSDYMEYSFNLHREKLTGKDILPGDLFNSFARMFEKNIHAGDWVNGSRIEPVRLFPRQAAELDIWNLENYPGAVGEKGYRLADVATIEKAQMPQDIAKENQQYRLCLQFEYIGSYQQSWKVTGDAIRTFNRTAPLGYKAESEYSHYWWDTGGSKQYGLLFLVAAIIFLTTGILFNSLKQPLVVIFIIPVSFIGLFLTFYLFNLNFDQGGFAAFILLAGLSVNANIYVLNEYNDIRRAHPAMMPMKAYLRAWNYKIRPIFLTIISTVLGFIPFMVGEYREAFWFPLAAGTIGGLVFSFLALFLFLPLFMGVGKRREYPRGGSEKLRS